MDHKQVATEILKAVGGKENVSSVTHCMTRLRFVLNDEELAFTEEIKKMKTVKGVVRQGGQYQIIVGTEVDQFYQAVIDLIGTQKNMNSGEIATKKKSLWDNIINTISGIFTPFLGVFAANGVLKGLLAAAIATGIMKPEMGVYIVLNAIADSVFYFMPILLGAAAAEKFGFNKYLGMVIGGSMIYPSIIQAASVEKFTFLHIPMGIANYTSTVFPAIITVYAASLLYKLFKRVCHKNIQFFMAPLLTTVVSVPLALIVIGPVVNTISSILSTILNGIYNFSPVICALVLGGPWMILVMLGLHWAFIPLFISELASTGYTSMPGLFTANQFAVAGAMLAVAVKSKHDKELKSLGISTGITCILGVSEPGIYGVLLPLKKPFITGIIAGSLGAIPAALMGTKVYAFGATGIFGFLNFIAPNGIDMGFYGAIISSLLGLILGFVLTAFLGMPKEEKENVYKNRTLFS